MKKFSLDDGFYYDLMVILDSGLLFWATLYIPLWTSVDSEVSLEALFLMEERTLTSLPGASFGKGRCSRAHLPGRGGAGKIPVSFSLPR